MTERKKYFLLCLVAVCLAYFVIVLGAYTRLTDSGLGCPDWPGCYGELFMPADSSFEAQANSAYPERPLEHAKAWTEMAHRYAAGTLGLLILSLAIFCGWAKKRGSDLPLVLPILLLGLVIFQAALGMWTVTLLLKPVVVMGHLLGGMSILALLWWLLINTRFPVISVQWNRVTWFILCAVCVLFGQIALGGWTSANYAALACVDFPQCQASWWPEMDFPQGFVLWRGTGIDYEGGILDQAARTAIHVTHRIGAVITFLVITAVSVYAMLAGARKLFACGLAVLVLLLLQVSLGIANVLLVLPLPIAVAHNGVAALLLLALITLLHFSRSIQTQAG